MTRHSNDNDRPSNDSFLEAEHLGILDPPPRTSPATGLWIFIGGVFAAGAIALLFGGEDDSPAADGVAALDDAHAPPARSQVPSTRSDLVQEVQEARTQIDSLQLQLSDSEAQLAAAEAHLTVLQADSSAQQSVLAASAAEAARLREQVASLGASLGKAQANRDQLKQQLVAALQELEVSQEELAELTLKNTAWRRTSADNLWFAFTKDAQLQVCERGTKRARERCQETVSTFFDAAAHERFVSCVSSHQAVPQLLKVQDVDSLPDWSTPLPEDNRQTRKGWAVTWCDPTLPEAVAAGEEVIVPEDLEEPQVFAVLE